MGMIWMGCSRPEAIARALLADEDGVDELLESEDDPTVVDLDKAWHGLHWLLTGNTEPTSDVASQTLLGGEPIGGDVGYGPGRLLSAQDVKAVEAHLRQLQPGTLRTRLDPAAMQNADVYPSIWDEDRVFDTFLAPAFEILRSFYFAAASADEAVIQIIC